MYLDVDLPTAHDDGRFVSAKVSRLVELIRAYDSHLDVKWVPPDLRGPSDPAFAITEQLADGREVVAFYIQDERDFDTDVLARIYAGDNTKQDVQGIIDARNKAVQDEQNARHREERYAYYDLMASMIKSGKHTYKHDGRKYNL
jgi:hypothetical protein